MTAAGGTPVIEVIIVNYNTGDALTRCVSSVLSEKIPLAVTVADNASADGSIERLKESFDGSRRLKVLENARNLGFARAVNDAAGRSRDTSKYLLILNPDCEVSPGAIEKLASALERDPAAALAGPMVVDRQNRPMRATVRRFPTPWTSFLTVTGLSRLGRWFPALRGVDGTATMPAGTARAEAVSGACFLIRRELFLDLGGMDESYGLHCEDLDLMYRAAQQGMHCLFVPSARVFHEQGVSSRSRPSWVHRQKHLGMQRFFLKFQAEKYPFPVRWLVLSGIWIRFLVTWPLIWLRN